MGPRRVGKTVLLNQLIEQTLKDGLKPENIFFASIDTPLYSGMALEQLLELYEKHTKCNANEKRLIIFDEIQYLKDWERHLKVLTDQYPNTRFIASGSAAAALKVKSQESGAGRFSDFFLPPLTFAEFLSFRNLEKGLISVKKENHDVKYDAHDIKALNSEFINYLNFGGYPEAVLNKDIQDNIQQFLGRDIIDKVLLRDLPSLYGINDIQELNRLFSTLAYHTGQEISLEGLSTNSGVKKHTIKKYLEYLEAAFLIVKVPRVDNTGKKFQRETQFKTYLTNPSMRTALFAPIEDSKDDKVLGSLAETAIFSQWFHSDIMKNIHYARWKQGRSTHEVDLVKVDSATLKPSWAYEIKWSDRHIENNSKDLKAIIEFAKKNNNITVGITTKTKTGEKIYEDIKLKYFPCALHCYQIGKNLTEEKAIH